MSRKLKNLTSTSNQYREDIAEMVSASKTVTILGGGIIGLSCAYYLEKEGFSVRVIDRNPIGESCAFGNAGFISPSHFVPLASPGMIKKGLSQLFDPEGAFHLKPRWNNDLWSWLLLFYQHCSKQHVNNVRQVLLNLCLESKNEFARLWSDLGESFQHESRGLYVICRTKRELKYELSLMQQAQKLGLNVETISAKQLHDKYQDMRFEIEGGIFFADDAHVHPGELLVSLHQNLKAAGVEFVENCEIDRLSVIDDHVASIGNNKQNFELDHLVLAGGCWSQMLAKQLGLKLPVQAGKGYSITTDRTTTLDSPMILSEAAVAVTPFRKKIRFGGTMELAGIDQSVNHRRVRAIVKAAERFLPGIGADKIDLSQAWSGLRPCSPDGLPFVGKVANYQNLQVATGHAMLGLTLAPVTGKIIAQQLKLEDHAALSFLSPDRFS